MWQNDELFQEDLICLFVHIYERNGIILRNVPIFYPLETPEDIWFSNVFKWYKIGSLSRNGLKNNSILCAATKPQNYSGHNFKDQPVAAVPRCSLKKDVFKIFCNIHRRTLILESLFNKVGDLKPSNFIKNRLQRRCFPVNIVKFFRVTFFIEHLRWLLLNNVHTSLHKKNTKCIGHVLLEWAHYHKSSPNSVYQDAKEKTVYLIGFYKLENSKITNTDKY